MDNTTYIALSRQQALWNQLDVIANNLANVNTIGFKGSDTLFAQYVYKSKSTDRPFSDKVSFTQDFGLVRNLAQGSFETTDNPFDVAIQGAGYFVVQDPTGANGQASAQHYTRNGSFTLNSQGQLVTQTGQLVLSTQNQPIQIPNDGSIIQILGDGTVQSSISQNMGNSTSPSTAVRTLGKIQVVQFADERNLLPVSGTQFAAAPGQTPTPVAAPHVAQGVLEDSNVNAINEMTRLINVTRAYEDIGKLIDEEHTRIQQTADTFTKNVVTA